MVKAPASVSRRAIIKKNQGGTRERFPPQTTGANDITGQNISGIERGEKLRACKNVTRGRRGKNPLQRKVIFDTSFKRFDLHRRNSKQNANRALTPEAVNRCS